jgi:hypothetical protein
MSTPNQQKQNKSQTVRTHARTGKIARLPEAIREQINQRLLDNQQGKTVVAWLNTLPEVQAVMEAQFEGAPVTESNLSEWRLGGHQDWLRVREARLALAEFSKETDDLQAVAKDRLTHQLAFRLAADAAVTYQQKKSEPEGPEKDKWRQELTGTVVALRRGDLEQERLQLQRERYGLRHKTKEEREQEFWKWAEENINRDEFCRRRCFTAAEREAEIDKILGITPTPSEPEQAAAPDPVPGSTPATSAIASTLIRPESDPIGPTGS